MGQWLDSRPIHFLSVQCLQSVFRCSDFVVTPLVVMMVMLVRLVMMVLMVMPVMAVQLSQPID